MMVVIAKKQLIVKQLLISKLNIELRNKLVRCYVWSIVLYGSETWILSQSERKYLESFEI